MKHLQPILFIAAVSILVVLLNVKAGTWLTGWDNLHPEFDVLLNIKRSLFAVWQEYQGLGLLGGMGHAADLPRQLFLGILSLVLPSSILRFVTTSLMLIIGPIGMYVLLQTIFAEPSANQTKKQILGMGGALFYLFNLATVQMFFVPFEAFVVHYGFLPWLFYGAFSYFKYSQKKYLVLFFIISLLSTTQSYVPTLFAVYLLALLAISAGVYIKERQTHIIKKAFFLFFVTICVNAFWLFPFTYFTITSSQIVVNAHENVMATEDIYLRNKEFGKLKDVSLLKGFWFNFVDIDSNNKFSYMVDAWRQHLSNPVVSSAGYALFSIVLLGIWDRIRRKDIFSYSLIFLFIIPFTLLANDTPPFTWIDALLKDTIPLFGQVFRVPFTKFSILAAFSYSLLFACGIHLLLDFSDRIWRYGKILVLTFVFILPIVFVFPMFKGNLFYSLNQLAIPKEYFELMNFFGTQERSERIANFPQHTYWGWNHAIWGYRGSGFMWYGTPQPILDRAFDGYSSNNENYYWELSKAMYGGNTEQLQNILEKYQVGWIVVDFNIVSLQSAKTLQLDKLITTIKQTDNVTHQKKFGNLSVYKVNLKTNPKKFVFLAQDMSTVGPNPQWNNNDQAYREYGNYINATKENDIYYPFRSLFTARFQDELEFNVQDKGSYFSFQTQIPKNLVNATLMLPPIFKEEITELDLENPEQQLSKYPQVFLDGEFIVVQIIASENEVPDSNLSYSKVPLPYIKEGHLEIRVPKIQGYYHYDTTKDVFKHVPNNACNPFSKGVYKYEKAGKMLRLISVGSNNCLGYDFNSFSQRFGYLVTVESKHTTGKSLLFSITEKQSEHSILETYLPKIKEKNTSYFVIPPLESFGIGYTIHIDNISIGKDATINELGTITIQPIPYRFLTALKIVKKDSVSKPIKVTFKVDHPNPAYYAVELNNLTMEQFNNGTIILSQSYDRGWKAYYLTSPTSLISQILPFLFGKELKEHVVINNWENGWLIPNNEAMKQLASLRGRSGSNNQTIVILYLPQYLEFLGFILLFGLLVRIVLWKAR